ncbi:hypothetical protein ACFP2T_27795 [Plantactinospora solaniradicis]|uniref:Uncharacterized protein n=1 Tax=Plantactinospora solaniradicis TaxID=1723736 RepID=A0ABW1KDY1_9ACTN
MAFEFIRFLRRPVWTCLDLLGLPVQASSATSVDHPDLDSGRHTG